MKEWDAYKPALLNHLRHAEIVDEHAMGRIIIAIQRFFDENLPCSYCGRVLPDESFYKGPVNVSRRCRQPVCKTCTPNYRSGKPFKKEGDK